MPDAPAAPRPTGDGALPFAGRVAASVRGRDDLALAWYRRGDDIEVELVAAPPVEGPEVIDTLVALYRSVVAAAGGPGLHLHLAADHPADRLDPLPEALAATVGLTERRDLHIMGRPLPVPDDHPLRAGAPAVSCRSFRPGVDDDAWLRANNRAFAAHADQGRETPETLATRMAEPWFAAADFLVADDPARPGELSGFCWTKVHPATADAPARGEIYVIGVDPAHRGEGLGPSFVLAGLDHLATLGLASALLYVDADNTPATRLYDRLGFVIERRRRVSTAPPEDLP